MKLEINLDDVWAYDGESLGTLLKNAIEEEVRFSVKRIVKSAIKDVEKDMIAEVNKAIKKDWKKASKILDELK